MPIPIPGFPFAAPHDVPVSYMERSRTYYEAMGYTKPYEWAHLAEVPFTPLKKPLARSSIALITTAAPVEDGKGDQSPGARINPEGALQQVYAAPCDPMPELSISHLHFDRDHTDGGDQAAFLPLPTLAKAVTSGRIGAVAPRVHGVPTRYSHRLTLKKDGPEILAALREDGAEIALLPAT